MTAIPVPASDMMNVGDDGVCNAQCTTEQFPTSSSFDVVLRCITPSTQFLAAASPATPGTSVQPSSTFVPGLKELVAAGDDAPDIMRNRIHTAFSPSNSSIRSSLPAFAVAWAYTVANRTISPELLTNITVAAFAAAARSYSGTNVIPSADQDMARFLNTSSMIGHLGIEIDSALTFSYAASAPLATPAQKSISLAWIAAPVILGVVCLLLLICIALGCSRRRKKKKRVNPVSNNAHDTSIKVRSK
jgi:hypothetical protein